VDVKGLFKKY